MSYPDEVNISWLDAQIILSDAKYFHKFMDNVLVTEKKNEKLYH